MHGNCSFFNMEHAVVQPCHTDLFTLAIHGCLYIAITFLIIHGNCSLSWHGNCSCPGMATAAVQAWQLQLCRDGNCSCSVMATAVVQSWQLQLSTMLLLLIHRLQLHFLWTHLCMTSMAGTWVPPNATCCTKVLHFFRHNS